MRDKLIMRRAPEQAGQTLPHSSEELLRNKSLFDEIQAFAGIGAWELDLENNEVFWSDQVYAIHEIPVGTPIALTEGINFYHPDYRSAITDAINMSIEEQVPWDMELKLITANQREIWVRAAGLPVVSDGKVVRLRGFFTDIDQKKKREEEREMANLINAMAIEAGNVGIWHWSIASGKLVWNESMHQIFDWSKDEFIGEYSDFRDRLHPDDLPTVEKALNDAVEDKRAFDIVYRVIDKKEQIRFIKAKSQVRFGNNKAIDMIGVCVDITESRSAYAREKALRKQLKHFIEHTPAAVAMLDTGLNYLEASDRWYSDFTLDKDSVIGKHHDEVGLKFGNTGSWKGIVHGVLEEKISKKDEIQIADIDGKSHWLKYEAYPWYSSKDELGGVSLFTEDITIRKAYEQSLIDNKKKLEELNNSLEQQVFERTKELEKTNEKYKDLYDNAPEMFISVSAKDGLIKECNQTYLSKTGYAKEEVIGKKVFNFYHPDSLDNAKRAFQKFIADGEVVNEALQLVTKNGDKMHVLLNVTAVLNDAGEVIESRSSWRDVTELHNAESKINELNGNLQNKVKDLENLTQELESFSYSVSHDLRAPLRIIDGFSRILLEDYAPLLDEEGEETIQSIIANTAKMSDLIDSLLTFSRVSRKVIERSEISTVLLVQEILNETRLITDIDGVKLDIEEGLPAVYGDRTLLKQVFANLVSNGIKYSRKSNPPHVEIFGSQQEGFSVITIRDNGVGFDMKYADKLFGVFQRLHTYDEFEGTGLGLALIKRIVERHEGEITVQAAVDKGAVFTVKLPIVK